MTEQAGGRTLSPAELAAAIEGLVPIQETTSPYGPLKWYSFGPWALKRPTWQKGLSVNHWIDTLEPGEVLWDVGANIGVYTIYAAARGLKVVAFEPEAGSFFILQKNLDLNGFHDHVHAMNVAISDVDWVMPFELAHPIVGAAQHKLRTAPGDNPYRQVLTLTGKHLTGLGLPYPDHIKVDVDGAEIQAAKGLADILNTVKSAVIECRDNGDADKVAEIFSRHGLEQSSIEASLTPGVRDVMFNRPPGTAHF